MSDASDERPDPNREHPVARSEVGSGVVFGLIVTFIYAAVVTSVSISRDVAGGLSTSEDWLFLAAYLVPVLLAASALASRKLRQTAAGFVMGLAIGVLLISGLCATSALPSLVG